ncbi:tetratricopeptide repeat protein [Solitalea sp. MAHUQ-68]|uniref:Tetratricopeptide repeat protein n=1 Tax=Solitalea agri TaxID=2953739 RepID=A0A9X2F392_9SPHI|nr:tetratricopeptide repeat protein [Solitalea agri]MCO4293436.1 tetratricopeptide repeat protein [Solitalea agri]
MKKVFLLFLFLLSLIHPAKANFDFNANCIEAYKSVLALKLDYAKTLIEKEKKEHPNNAIVTLLENYHDFYTIFTSESEADFNRLKSNKSTRLRRIEKEDERSPYYLFCQAEINIQWAITRARFGEYYTAALEINRAYGYLKDNRGKFPQFWPNNKDMGILNIVMGNVPSGLKSVLSTFGVNADIKTGVNMMEQALMQMPGSEYSFFYDETALYLSYVLNDIVGDDNAYAKSLKYLKPVSDSCLLKSFVQGYVCMKTAHNNEAISIFSSRPSGVNYAPFKHLEYLLATAKLNRMDDDADLFFQKYLTNYRGVFNIKDSYLRIGWSNLLDGDLKKYQQSVTLVKTKGYDYNDKDKHALKEVEGGVPDLYLLGARLLYDGGYYDRALNVLKSKKITDQTTEKDKLEYSYRMGRIFDALKDYDKAMHYYTLTVESGSGKQWYFAANSALSLGKIYENQKNYVKAKQYYKLCIDMKDHEYKNSIDAKAKAGLKRLK